MKISGSNRSKIFEDIFWNQKIAGIASRLLLATMMACFLVPITLVFKRIMPDWNFNILVPVGFVLTLEAMYAAKKLRGVAFTDKTWIAYRLSELVVLVILIKIIMYSLDGFQQFFIDLPDFKNNFFETFFPIDFVIALAILFTVWVISGDLGSLILQLEDDEQILKIEEDSGFSEQRYLVREQFVRFILVMGGVMVVLTSMVRMDSGGLWGETASVRGGVVSVMIFFACGVLLLSLTQFSVMRVKWILNHVQMHRLLARNWVLYSIGCLLLIFLISILLPTTYSRGFLLILQNSIGFLFSLLQMIVSLILTPFIFFIGWLINLFSRNVDTTEPEPAPQVEITPFMATSTPSPFIELLKTIMFWGLLIGLVIFSFTYYIREHPEYVAWLRKFGLGTRLNTFWQWLSAIFGKTKQSIIAFIDEGLNRLRGASNKQAIRESKGFHLLRNLTAREQIVYYYLAMLRRGEERGLPRKSSQTPNEYAQDLAAAFSEKMPGINPPGDMSGEVVREDITRLTEAFVEAKYSCHDIPGSRVNIVKQAWYHIQKVFKSRNKKSML